MTLEEALQHLLLTPPPTATHPPPRQTEGWRETDRGRGRKELPRTKWEKKRRREVGRDVWTVTAGGTVSLISIATLVLCNCYCTHAHTHRAACAFGVSDGYFLKTLPFYLSKCFFFYREGLAFCDDIITYICILFPNILAVSHQKE